VFKESVVKRVSAKSETRWFINAEWVLTIRAGEPARAHGLRVERRRSRLPVNARTVLLQVSSRTAYSFHRRSAVPVNPGTSFRFGPDLAVSQCDRPDTDSAPQHRRTMQWRRRTPEVRAPARTDGPCDPMLGGSIGRGIRGGVGASPDSVANCWEVRHVRTEPVSHQPPW
jgi:hypothetical protein